MGLGIVLIIIGIIVGAFASVSHITDSTVKAAGWILLNKILGFVSAILVIVGVLALIGGIAGAL